MTAASEVAVLGAGIMGCSLALYLARQGVSVSLFDAADQPFTGASRWNEGKIHLGYLYSADPSLRTASHLIDGGLLFRPLVEKLIGRSIAPVITAGDDIYLCHRNSVVTPDAMGAYMTRVSEQVRSHPDADSYLEDASHGHATHLSAAELSAVTDSSDILAGFRVPERSVQTTWVADRFIEAVEGEPRIKCHMLTRILAAEPLADSIDGPWQLHTTEGTFKAFSSVVNALWEGRPAIDKTAGLTPAGPWSNRYRQSLFMRTRTHLDTPCAIIATGPFGDIKNYNGRDFYLSWYPDGLRTDSSDIDVPALDALDLPDPGALSESIYEHLQALLPWVRDIRANAESFRIEGGWVFAAGCGRLSDPYSTLHKRSDYGVTRRGNYFSVDTGKYSTAPWSARKLVDQLT